MDDSPRPVPVAPGDFGYERVVADHDAIRSHFPCYKCDPERDDSWPDFEQLVTVLDESAKYQDAFERVTGSSSQNWTNHLKQVLLHHLGERLSHLTEIAPVNGAKVIESFVKQLEQQSDAVISFNWDVLLEIAAAKLGIAVHYQTDRHTGIQVAKPHGSLNLVDSSVTEYEAVKVAFNVHSLDIEFNYEDDEPRIILRAQNPTASWLRQTWASERLLVEPNIRKSYDTFWLSLQWARALHMVRRADELIVIGFSLPETDLRARLLLQLSGVQRSTQPRLVVVAPDAEWLSERYCRLTGLRVVPFVGTLQDWIAQKC